MYKRQTLTRVHTLRHPLGQAKGNEGLGPIVNWVVFNGCILYRCVSPCRGSGPCSQFSARESVRGVASAASRVTSRRPPAPSPCGGSRRCGTPCWVMKRRDCAPPSAPRRRVPASTKDKGQDREPNLQMLRAPRTPRYRARTRVFRHVRNKRRNRHPCPAVGWAKLICALLRKPERPGTRAPKRKTCRRPFGRPHGNARNRFQKPLRQLDEGAVPCAPAKACPERGGFSR